MEYVPVKKATPDAKVCFDMICWGVTSVSFEIFLETLLSRAAELGDFVRAGEKDSAHRVSAVPRQDICPPERDKRLLKRLRESAYANPTVKAMSMNRKQRRILVLDKSARN